MAGAIAAMGLGGASAYAAPARADVRGIDDKALKSLIQQVIGQSPAPVSRLEARRRARDAGEQVTAVLRSEGYLRRHRRARHWRRRFAATLRRRHAGPRTYIAEPKISWADTAPDAGAAAMAFRAMGLTTGSAGRAENVIAAEGRIVATLQQRGYADAATAPRQVVVDHADHTMRPNFHIRSGPLVRLGGVVVEGKGRTRAAWVTRLASWKRGDPYRPEAVAELERLLVDTGAYDQVTVSLAPADRAVNGQRPVIVSLAERPKGTLELGASYSTTEGAGVDSRWIVYNRLGRADTVTTMLRFAQIDSRLQTELALPNWRRARETLKLTAAVYRDKTPAYDLTGVGLTADLTHRFGATSFVTYGASVNATKHHREELANFITSIIGAILRRSRVGRVQRRSVQ